MSTMAEGTYEYECMRAELLGIEKPDRDEFLKKKQEQIEVSEQDVENLKEADHEQEQMKQISGGLDELNSILQVTQRKINKFRASCSSFTSLLKFKLSSSSSDSVNGGLQSETSDVQPATPPNSANGDCHEDPRKSDLAKALDAHVDRLDSMIEKAENAQYSMARQTKEMKRFVM